MSAGTHFEFYKTTGRCDRGGRGHQAMTTDWANVTCQRCLDIHHANNLAAYAWNRFMGRPSEENPA